MFLNTPNNILLLQWIKRIYEHICWTSERRTLTNLHLHFISITGILSSTKRVKVGLECWGPASAGSRGYPQDERCRQERERRHVKPALIGPSLRMNGETERERERERVTRQGCLQGLAMLYFLL